MTAYGAPSTSGVDWNPGTPTERSFEIDSESVNDARRLTAVAIATITRTGVRARGKRGSALIASGTRSTLTGSVNPSPMFRELESAV